MCALPTSRLESRLCECGRGNLLLHPLRHTDNGCLRPGSLGGSFLQPGSLPDGCCPEHDVCLGSLIAMEWPCVFTCPKAAAVSEFVSRSAT